MAKTFQDVIEQMAECGIAGLQPSDLVADGKKRAFRPDSQRKNKKSAWYVLYEHRTRSGQVVYTGAFGDRDEWFKVKPSDSHLSTEERAEFARAQKEKEREAARLRKEEAVSAATKAARLWVIARDEGANAYLDRKQVRAYGVRFLRDSLVVPLRDAEGNLAGCQFIDAEGGKRFNTGIEKTGRFHVVGTIRPDAPILFGEGYATCASAHMATEWPVVVCFDSGNLEPVASTFRSLYPEAQFVFIGDDDRHLRRRLRSRLDKLEIPGQVEPDGVCHVFHTQAGEVRVSAAFVQSAGIQAIELTVERDGQAKRSWILENAGRKSALACAKKFEGVAVFPSFSAADAAGTDFNDLHLAEGLGVVRSQILNGIQVARSPAAESISTPKESRRRGGDGEGNGFAFSQALKHWALIYPTDTVWDGIKRRIVKVPAMKLHYGEGLVKIWLEHPDRRMVMDYDVLFDPTEKCDPVTQVNLFEGWPVAPDPNASCERLKAHLYDVCGEDDGLFSWVVRWLAYPLQNPGAKMRTALIVHGPEGTGKSILFDVIRDIYGEYARMVTQLQLQSEYTDWLSRMMFCVAEEVVTRQELKHHKGLLKNLVTNPVVNINEKYMPLRTERNHANFVFLSNEMLPMALDQGDRRYTVIWYEPSRGFDEAYFKALGAEIAAGGVAGLYAWLLEQDLGNFTEHTRPYENHARKNLITLGMPARDRFYAEWSGGLINDLPFGPARVEDVYAAFRRWCGLVGERFVDNMTTFGTLLGRHMLKGVRKGSVWVWDRAEEGGYSRRVKNRASWRGTVVLPKDWKPGEDSDPSDAMFAAVRAFQDSLEMYQTVTKHLMVA